MSKMPSTAPVVRVVSQFTVKPDPGTVAADDAPAAHPRRCELSSCDISMLSLNYIQKGHLFSLPSQTDPSVDVVLDCLKISLSLVLWHFYPLAGCLATEKSVDGEGMYVYIDCNDQGAEFVHAVADGVSVADVLAPSDGTASFVRGFFPLDGAISYDGRTLPLLAVQVTKLADGVFVGCAFNHVVGDGTSFWDFFNAWAEISRSKGSCSAERVSRPPVHDRWFVDGKSPIKLPFTHEAQFIERVTHPPLRERMFHFSAASIAGLKAKANDECGTDSISSFQALSALMWRCITRLRHLPDEEQISCRLAAENRTRMRPQLPAGYFGNSICAIVATATAGELLSHGLGWAARLVHESVASHTEAAIRRMVETWMASPVIFALSMFGNLKLGIFMGSSPRFDMYGCDFGWGRAVALRSGSANKYDGKVSAFPGREGGGTVDLEVCLRAEDMTALETDEEFLNAVSRT